MMKFNRGDVVRFKRKDFFYLEYDRLYQVLSLKYNREKKALILIVPFYQTLEEKHSYKVNGITWYLASNFELYCDISSHKNLYLLDKPMENEMRTENKINVDEYKYIVFDNNRDSDYDRAWNYKFNLYKTEDEAKDAILLALRKNPESVYHIFEYSKSGKLPDLPVVWTK